MGVPIFFWQVEDFSACNFKELELNGSTEPTIAFNSVTPYPYQIVSTPYREIVGSTVSIGISFSWL